MKRINFILLLFLSLLICIFSLQKINTYLKNNPAISLKSPFQTQMFPIAIGVDNNIYYNQINNTTYNKPVNFRQIVFAVSPLMCVAFIYSLLAIFFGQHSKIKKREQYFIIFSICIILYYLTFVDYITDYHIQGTFYLMSFLIGLSFIAMVYGLFKEKIPTYHIFIGIILSLLLTYIFYPHNHDEEKIIFQIISYVQVLCILFVIIIFRKKIFRKKNYLLKNQDSLFINILAISLIVSIFTPTFAYSLTTIIPIKMNVRNNAIFFTPALFPVLYFLFAVRFGLLKSKIIIPDFFVRLLFFIFFIFFYWFSIGHWLFSNNNNSIYSNIIIVAIFLTIIEISRSIIYYILDKQAFKRKEILNLYFNKSSNEIYHLHTLDSFIQQVIEIIKDGLEIDDVKFYFNKKVFKNLDITFTNIYCIDSDLQIWQQINFRKKIFKYPKFNLLSAQPISNFIKENHGYILIAFNKLDLFILLSNKINKYPFISEDLYFIKNILKQIEPIIQNYIMLLTKQNLKNKENELEITSKIQNKILPTSIQNSFINIQTLIIPFQKVTGDYVDFIQKDENNYIIFLGDISGHGLGGAYLMSMCRSIIHAIYSSNQYDLPSIFTDLNNFLIHDYRGNDFLTLMAIDLHINPITKEISLKYINAGQHPGLIYDKNKNEIQIISNNQRVLGVIETNYKTFSLVLKNNIRIILYSDGIFESFSETKEMLGEELVNQWIYESSNLQIDEQKNYLYEKIKESSKTYLIADDISLIFIDITL